MSLLRGIRRVSASSSSLVVGGTVTLAVGIMIGRMADSSTLGVYQSSLSLVNLLVLFFPAALGSAASAYIAKASTTNARSELEQTLMHLRVRYFQSGIALAVIGGVIGYLLDSSSYLRIVAIAGLILGLSGYSVGRGQLYGQGQINKSVRWEITTALAFLLCALIGLGYGVGATGLLLILTSRYGLYSLIALPRVKSVTVPSSIRRELDRFTVYGVLGTVGSAGFMHLSMVIARTVGGAEGAGQFGAAILLTTPLTIFSTGTSMVLFPHLARAHSSKDQELIKSSGDLATRVLVLILVPSFGIAAILSPELVTLVWGSDFSETAFILPSLLIAVMLNALAVPAVTTITSESSLGARASMVFTSIGFTIGVLSWAFTIPLFGLNGLAMSYLIGMSLTAALPFGYTWRRTRHNWAGVAIRVVLATALLLAVSMWRRLQETSTEFGVTSGVIFILFWTIISWRDIRLLGGRVLTEIQSK